MSYKTAQKLRSRGFTLLELLVVIAIIGLLAGIATVSFGSARAKARDARRVSEVKQYQTAINIFNENNNAYPAGAALVLGTAATASCLDNTGFTSTATPCGGARGVVLLDRINAAPTPLDGSCTTASNDYQYNAGSTDFSLTFCIGQGTGGLIAGSHTATATGIR